MKIKVITPIISDVFIEEALEEFTAYTSRGTDIDVCNLDYGPESIESAYDDALCAPDFLKKAIEAENQGYDGIISNCFGDPAVKAAREILNIPVVGAGEASMLYASLLGSSFSVLSVLPNVYSTIENISKTLGVNNNLAAIRSVNIPVLDVNQKEKLIDALYGEMVRSIKEDNAHVLILGCTGMMGVAANLQKRLKEIDYDIPVIDPAYSATKMLESIISMGLKQSKLTYMKPPQKKRTSFP